MNGVRQSRNVDHTISSNAVAVSDLAYAGTDRWHWLPVARINDPSGLGVARSPPARIGFVLQNRDPRRKNSLTRPLRLSLLLGRLGGFAADCGCGRGGGLCGAGGRRFSEADAGLITVGELNASRL